MNLCPEKFMDFNVLPNYDILNININISQYELLIIMLVLPISVR